MYAQLRLAQRAPRAIVQRRTLATTPQPPANTAIPSTPLPPSGVAPIRPTVHPIPPSTPGSSTLPPKGGPVPPPSPPRSGLFRRVLIYTALGVLVFYPTSGYLSTKSETYRELFTAFPAGEWVADYADDNGWDHFGIGTVSQSAIQGWQRLTGDKAELEAKAAEARKKTEARAKDLEEAARVRLAEASKKAVAAKNAAKANAVEVKKDVAAKATEIKDKTVAVVKEVASDAKAKVTEATSSVPFNFSEGVEGIVRECEKVLGIAEDTVAEVKKTGEAAIAAKLSPLPDTQRPRELRPETVQPQKPSYEGKVLYTGPPLPLGHEPPPGFYLAPPPSKEKKAEAGPVKPVLPLLVPQVKEFAASEPIISQLATTIDSLTSSLSAPAAGGPSKDASGILSRAQDDLTALSKRLDEVKKTEREKLEKTVGEKTKEFESILKTKEEEWKQGEAGLKEGWESERQKMIDGWRQVLDLELESQREGIEKRLREEVVSQGIELQRRWLRSIKSQVESERGGRLAKLDSLTTSLKQLERITLDNSAVLDDNVRLHKIWSALRAVQSKAEQGDASFGDELRVLQSLSVPAEAGSSGDAVIKSALSQLELSGIAQTGVKSFASLSSWFTNSVAPRIHSASLVPAPHEASVGSHIASATLSKLLFRPKAGLVEGDDVGAVLARAEWALGEKDLDAATREVNSLRGWPRELAKDWLREARRKLEVNQALEIVGTEATLSSLLLV